MVNVRKPVKPGRQSSTRFATWVLALASACLPSVALAAATNSPTPAVAAADDIFQSPRLLRIAIDIPEAGMEILRDSRPRRALDDKPKALATVREGGRVFTNVTAQLKGFSSFRPIDGLPSFTLNFDRLASGQKFHGLGKISLNNSVQDASRLNEKLSREMFAAAGVPVPRSDHAVVTLNGRELGLYVLAEGFDKEFLKRHFERADGNLYDGGVLQDIDRPLEVSSGKSPEDHSALQRLIRAAREPVPARRFRAIESALDMDRFLSMVAVEAILCHSDSYSMNRNNYRLYHDPVADRMVFMPHGMDRVLGTHRSTLDLPVVPPLLGMVARATLSTPEGRRRYVERAGTLFTNLFVPERLCRRVREIEATIADELANQPSERRFGRGARQGNPQGAADTCERIATRAAELALQFAHPEEYLDAPPVPAFGPDGRVQIEGWHPRRRSGQPDVSCASEVRDGRQLLRVRIPEASLDAAVRARLSLPPGRYRLGGQVKVSTNGGAGAGAGAGGQVSVLMLRYSGSRFGAEWRRLDARNPEIEFQITDTRAPEEIEIICEIRGAGTAAWLDFSGLQLTRRGN